MNYDSTIAVFYPCRFPLIQEPIKILIKVEVHSIISKHFLYFIVIVHTTVESSRSSHLTPTTLKLIFQLIVKSVLGDILQTCVMQQMLTEDLAGRYSVNIHSKNKGIHY